RDHHAVLVLGHALEAHTEGVVDAALAERALETLAHGLVFVGNEVGKCFDDRDVRSERLPDTRELDADDAATEHSNLLRNEVQLKSLLARDDAASDVETGERTAVRTRCEDDVLACDRLVADLDRRR